MDDLSNQLEWYKGEWQLMSDELDQAMDDLQEEEYLHKLSRAEVVGLRIKLTAAKRMVDEYDLIFDRYVSLTDTKLITNQINNLRKQGGYPPL